MRGLLPRISSHHPNTLISHNGSIQLEDFHRQTVAKRYISSLISGHRFQRFTGINLHSNTSIPALPLEICEIVYSQWLPRNCRNGQDCRRQPNSNGSPGNLNQIIVFGIGRRPCTKSGSQGSIARSCLATN